MAIKTTADTPPGGIAQEEEGGGGEEDKEKGEEAAKPEDKGDSRSSVAPNSNTLDPSDAANHVVRDFRFRYVLNVLQLRMAYESTWARLPRRISPFVPNFHG